MPRFTLGSSPPSSSPGFESPSLRFPTMQSPPLNSPYGFSASSYPPPSSASMQQHQQHQQQQQSPAFSTGNSSSNYSPNNNQVTVGRRDTAGAAVSSSSSVHLACSNGDGTAVISLGYRPSSGGFLLERRSLPLDDETTTMATPPTRQLQLPRRLQAALDLSPPVELFYVGANDEHSTTAKSSKFKQHQQPSSPPSELFCLYTRKDVFYLEVSTTTNSSGTGTPVVEVTPAFEHYFRNAEDNVEIVRIRPAPQRRNDYATLCPRGAMAMLTHDPSINQYALVLQHQKEDPLVSSPLRFSLEQLSGQEEDITDFCFAQSEGLSLLSSMSILMVKGSGDVLAASPILFDGCVVPRSKLEESIEFLDYQIEMLAPNSAKCKQCKAAKSFVREAFGAYDDENSNNNHKSQFHTAHVLTQGPMYGPVTWPVQIQGPFLTIPREEATTNCQIHPAIVIENFTAADLIGFAVGGDGYSIDLGLVPPSCLLPRFSHETADDGYDIDDGLMNSGAIVQRLILNDNDEDGGSSTATTTNTTSGLPPLSNQSLALLRDPLLDSMMHYVTPTGVTTVNTTAMRHMLRHLSSGGGASRASSESKTSAWASVTASSSKLEGAILVGNDTRLGHALIARLSDGTMVPVNVTEAQYLHEMDHLIHGGSEVGGEHSQQKLLMDSTPSGAAAKQLESVPPLYQQVEPLMKRITSGLAGMGKIVGSQTQCKDIQPDMLAVAIGVKERCDKEVILPMLELKETVNSRREVLKKMQKDQMKQIASLKQTVATLQEQIAAIEATAETAQENAKGIAVRSTAVLQGSQDLVPTMTREEYNYFQQLKRLKANLEDMHNKFAKIEKSLVPLRENIDRGRFQANVNLDANTISHLNKLQDGEDIILTRMEANMSANEERARRMMSDAGLVVTGPPGRLWGKGQ